MSIFAFVGFKGWYIIICLCWIQQIIDFYLPLLDSKDYMCVFAFIGFKGLYVFICLFLDSTDYMCLYPFIGFKGL